jgi:hypothetical protein
MFIYGTICRLPKQVRALEAEQAYRDRETRNVRRAARSSGTRVQREAAKILGDRARARLLDRRAIVRAAG